MHATRALRNSYSLALKIHCTRGYRGSSLTTRIIIIDTIFGQNQKTLSEKSKRTPTCSEKSLIQPGRRHPEVVDGVWLVVWNGSSVSQGRAVQSDVVWLLLGATLGSTLIGRPELRRGGILVAGITLVFVAGKVAHASLTRPRLVGMLIVRLKGETSR